MTTASLGLSRADRPILISALFILVILIVGTAYTFAQFGSAPLLSPTYLLQQLQIGAFLGIVAAGMMIVILIAQIDLSVPWTLAAAVKVQGTERSICEMRMTIIIPAATMPRKEPICNC